MRLSELLGVLPEKRVGDFDDIDITGLAYDSRTVRSGDAFFCIKGLVTDGHLYAIEAVRKGAVAIFCEKELEESPDSPTVKVFVPDSRRALALCSAKFYRFPSRALKVVGVTGTNGKTTTTFLIEKICAEAGMKSGLIGTIENHIGQAKEPVTRTTPESLDLSRLLRRMAGEKVEVVAMEVSSHALELRRVVGIDFDMVIFTNLTQDHLDFHISIEEYFAAKKKLFTSDEYGKDRSAFVNADDPFGLELLDDSTLPCTTYSIDFEGADVRAKNVEISPDGNRFLIESNSASFEAKTNLKGRFNVYNCLAASAVALELGIEPEIIRRGLSTFKGVPGRFESIESGQDFTVIVDYAHTPDGVRNLLEACREIAEGRVIVVVGCGGDRDRSKRPEMGRIATELSNLCIITSDNPRSEEPSQIIEMILEGVKGAFPPDRYRVEIDRRKAIDFAIRAARKNDVVAIAGKGHETGQIFRDRVIPFDDREVAREILSEVTGEDS
ncbi:MAG: UDP-N-acetylmuramoyl-L-alanyl-D-glutamate--2,6-diaminopimelate ligase [Actinomycetota bacterium]|nr:UDP-N-acetylmuramoyl-L-alanyl-D-glutamate--2,6-diaminopimelate ligase [Actinomycetota bacterium]